MPNHIQCRLTAPRHVIDSLKSDESIVDFDKIKPMPPALWVEASGGTINAAERALLVRDCPYTETYGLLGLLHEANLSRTPSPLDFSDKDWGEFLQLLENRRKYGFFTSYQWCVTHWGTKWNAYSCKAASETDVCFQTAWRFPGPVMAALSCLHPDDEIVIEYASQDYGNNFGRVAFRRGVGNSLPSDIALVARLWGLSNKEMKEFGLQ